MDSPLISSHTNKLKATIDPSQPFLKQLYVTLPGHPFYGQQVKILQTSATDTMKWALFEHPKHEYFHYRISQSWLSETPPPEIIPSDRKNTQFVLSFSALQRFAKILLAPVEPDDLEAPQLIQPPIKQDNPLKEAELKQNSLLIPFSRNQRKK